MSDSAVPPVQRTKVERTVDVSSQAVLMDSEGSIFGGRVTQELSRGMHVVIDDADGRRSSRGMKTPDGAIWYRALIIGTTDVSGEQIFVPDSALAAVSPETAAHAREARDIHALYGHEVEGQIHTVMEAIRPGDAPSGSLASVRGALAFFLWLAKIGDDLGKLFPELQAVISQRIEQSKKTATEDQRNEDSEQGMIFEGMLIKPINDRLKTWAAVLAGSTAEVIETLSDMATTPEGTPKLDALLNDVPQNRVNLFTTFAGYLQLGRTGIDKAIGAGLNKNLYTTLDAISGCYAAQAQRVEWLLSQERSASSAPSVQPIDPDYNPWMLQPKQIGYFDISFNGNTIEGLIGVEGAVAEVGYGENVTGKLAVGDALKSGYVNPGYVYKIHSISETVMELRIDRG